jgi:Uma2 family endonuclease
MGARNISVEEYLATVYRPGRDYVDGEVIERNFGDRDHSSVQAALGSYFFERRKNWGIQVYSELRLYVRSGTYRIADLCVALSLERPFLCVEIQSPEDRFSDFMSRIDDYFTMGVANVWMVDPGRRCAFVATPAGDLHRITDVLRTTEPVLEVPLAEIFE